MNCQGEPPWRLKIPCWSHQLQFASGPAQSETIPQPSGRPARAADVSWVSIFPRQVSWLSLELARVRARGAVGAFGGYGAYRRPDRTVTVEGASNCNRVDIEQQDKDCPHHQRDCGDVPFVPA
jgi:hypothetical protein